MTSVAPLGMMTLVVILAVLTWGTPLASIRPVDRSGWISIRIMLSSEMNGRSLRRVPVLMNWTCWTVLVRLVTRVR